MTTRIRVLVLAASALMAVRLLAAPVVIKLATAAPAGSMWDKALRDMGSQWSKDTSGRVTLNVFPASQQGDEATTIRKMRPGAESLHAALLTAVGLSDIDDAFNVFNMPFFFETDDEEAAVQQKLEPRLEQALQAKGLHFLSWGTGGWVQIFSKKPLKTLADVKGAKLFTSKGDDRMVQWYTSNGFNPKPLLPNDIPAQLKLPTGMIDTTPDTPYLALTMQIYGDAKYMMDVRIAPLVGAMIISNTSWNQIAADDRAKMTTAARTLESQIRSQAPKQDADSITAMTAHGLQVIKLDAKAAADFRAAATDLVKSMRGGMVPADVYDMAVQERDAFRKSKGR